MAKMLQFNEEALRSIHRGVKQLAKAVIVTLGPKGRNVVINKGFGSTKRIIIRLYQVLYFFLPT